MTMEYTVIPATVSLVTIPGENTGDDLRKHLWQETLAHDHSEAVRIAENVVVLEVRAIPETGFSPGWPILAARYGACVCQR
ncbi:hypothetical protein MJ253_14730 [Citrobacter freundii]|uniref:hypothetical protein n=1 Tax=Citrobacter freundii TaxID=546 RepID=UPI001F068D59|nr:hypothetical protein [Citrobacter freundii]UMB62681.1 hypothetical protein MJ253_14730 [Citrobacter freundii]